MTEEFPRIKMIDIKPCDECQEFMATHVIVNLYSGENKLLCPDCYSLVKTYECVECEKKYFDTNPETERCPRCRMNCLECGEECEEVDEEDHCIECATMFQENDYTGGTPEINDRFIKADYDRKIEKGE